MNGSTENLFVTGRFILRTCADGRTVARMTANARTEANGAPTLRLKRDEFDKLARAVLGQELSDRELAERLGVDHRHYSQLRTGKRNPGAGFIAAVKIALPNVAFDQIFEVVVDPVATGDAA